MQQPIVVREVHTEHVHDTIKSHDSIYIDRWHTIRIKGDTVYIQDSTNRVEHHTNDRTTDIAHGDSIPYEVEVPVEVPYTPPFYKNCTIGFWLLLLIIIGSIAIRVLVKYIKYRARMPTIL